jgi:glutathionylspermidine synthase
LTVRRVTVTPRPDWYRTVRSQGLVYTDTALPDGQLMSYWDESACYELTLAEVERLEEVTERLHGMCVAAARHVVAHGRYAEYGIPAWAAAAVARSLDSDPPSLYGRFDLWYDGVAEPKLLEYNADTPTSLVEASIVQWYWLADRFPGADQWNSLHERLVEAWRSVTPALRGELVHFGWDATETTGEDLLTVGYLADTATQAGLRTAVTPMHEFGWDGRRFVGADDEPVDTCFKLYPWEWMLTEPYGRLALAPTSPTTWIEPAWKLLLSNKALLAVLWELYPDHPNLLPSYLDGPRDLRGYVAKPLLGREGASIRVVSDSYRVEQPGNYGAEGYCYQQLQPLPTFDGNHVVLGSWVVTGVDGRAAAAGAGFRESSGLITDGYARFLPHLIPAG